MARARSAAPLCAALLAAAGARADGLSGLIEEDFSTTHLDSTDQSGAIERTASWQLIQRYRLNLERSFYPQLRFAGGGVLEQLLGKSETAGVFSDLRARQTTLYANLTAGSPILGGVAGYNRHDLWQLGSPDRFVNEVPSLALIWKPAELPSFSLRLSRAALYDTERRSQDTVTTQAIFSMQYLPDRHLDLRYSFDYSNPQDRLHSTDTIAVTQTAGANYAQHYDPWNTSVGAVLNLTERRTLVTAAGPGGALTTQVFPTAGLSAVEIFPATSALDTLQQNPALIDGNTTASAGINIGYNPTLAGDVGFRDIGVQLVDALTQVNTFYLWVVDANGRPLSVAQPVADTLRWTAWQSDDNLHWTQLAIAAAGVVFSPFLSRFEITLLRPASARYLKLVTRPLAPAATTDKTLADIAVTEVQVFLVTPVARSTGWQGSNSELFTLGLRTQVLGRPDLSYDVSLQLARAEQAQSPAVQTYLLANGLSYGKRLSPVFLLSARLARQDFDQTRGHESNLLYSASLAADELPTLGHTLAYSGQTSSTRDGVLHTNSISLYNRATPYRGIGLLAGFSLNLADNLNGQTERSNVITLNTTLQPHPSLTLAGTYGRTGTVVTGGGQPSLLTHSQLLQGTASFNPFPALYIAGGVQRTITDQRGYTLENLAVGVSPFPGGALQFSFSYNETVDSTGQRTRLITPALRWNIHRSAVAIASYSFIDTESTSQSTRSRTFDINLRIPL